MAALTRKYPGIKFIGVGIDDNTADWNQAKKYFPGWIHAQAKGKWNDPVVEKYNLSALPVFYVLDKEKK